MGMTERIVTLDQLAALYGTPNDASTRKECDRIHPLYRRLIDASPFLVLATSGPDGLDASPRGDPAGALVAIEDDGRTLLLPDRRGNNRLDSLLSIEPALLARFEVQGQKPRCVVVVEVHTVFFQCARAIQRSRLWQEQTAPTGLPTPGEILAEMTDGSFDGARYDRELRPRQRATLY
jgi:predicted pyridoxine 5'-phosphate oxidase superfamily flavin-nucleotide-binding protein